MVHQSLEEPETWVLVLILVSTALRIAIGSMLPLGGDEAYLYWLGTHFHLSYHDNPPLVFWMAGLAGKAGSQVGFVAPRLPFILMFSGSTWLMFLIGRRLFGGRSGFCAALLFNLAGFFPICAGTFVLPEGPLVFFWLACSWCLVRLFFEPELDYPLMWWLAAGVTLGLALISKYHAVFLLFGAGLFVLTQPQQRPRLLGPGPYLAMGAAGIFFLPVLVWNYQHDWVSFGFQFGKGLRYRGIFPAQPLMSLLGQCLYMMPWIWVLLVKRLIKGFGQGPKTQKDWFMCCMGVGPIAVFTAYTLYSAQWYYFHWPMVGYLLLFPALGRWINWSKRSLAAVTALSLVVGFVFVSHGAVGWLNPLNRSFKIKMLGSKWGQRNMDMSGFQGLAEFLEEKGLAGRDNIFVITNNYMDSGRVAWTLRGKYPVLSFSERSDLYLSYPFIDRSAGWRGADAIAISRREDVTSDLAFFSPYFRRSIPLGSVMMRRGLHEKVLQVYLFEDMFRPFPPPYSSPGTSWQ